MSKEIQTELLQRLADRGTWEQRQRIWYEMVRDGLTRRNKPFPGAADLHLPIADNAVEKLKPYYVTSIFSRNTLASFRSLKADLASAADAAAEALDWALRNESNFQWEMGFLTHYMLAQGRGIMKTRWDHEARGGRGKLVFEALDPLYFIGQPEVYDIDEMDLFCHVKQISVARYKRTAIYKQDAAFIERIRGGENQADNFKDQEKEIREGLTSTKRKDLIILWETWERVSSGWKVSTFAPSMPEEPVREDFVFPVRFQGDPIQPFVGFQAEITEKGWYSPRGITEKVAPFEAYGCKVWNQQADWLEWSSKPLFARDPNAPLTNTNMQKVRPGDIMPPGVKPFEMPAPPFQLDEELNRNRMLAEESAGVPDFGVTPEGDGKETRTATEMQYVGSFASQGIQYKAFVNGLCEGKLYRVAWAMLLHHGSEELVYYSADSRKVLPQQALHDEYLVQPNSSPDQWDKSTRAKRSTGRFVMFKGHPNINQEELVKCVIEDDDARLVKRLFVSTGTKAANEKEDEAFEIMILLEGYPASVSPGEDHVTRLQMLFGKLQQLSQLPPPQTPEELARMTIGRQRMHEHVAAHMQALQQENPAMAKQFQAAIAVIDPSGAQGAPAGPGMPQIGPGAGAPPVAEAEPMGLPEPELAMAGGAA